MHEKNGMDKILFQKNQATYDGFFFIAKNKNFKCVENFFYFDTNGSWSLANFLIQQK